MNILEPSTDPRETVLQCHITRFTPQGVDDLTTTTETVLDPAESTIVNTGPSREDIHKSGMVNCILLLLVCVSGATPGQPRNSVLIRRV